MVKNMTVEIDGTLVFEQTAGDAATQTMREIASQFSDSEWEYHDNASLGERMFIVKLKQDESEERFDYKNTNEIVAESLKVISDHAIRGYATLEFDDSYSGSKVYEIGFSEDHRADVYDSFNEELIKKAMNAAGYSYDSINSGEGHLSFNYEGGTASYENWTEVKVWLELVDFDDPEVSDRVEMLMHPEHFDTPESGQAGAKEMFLRNVEPFYDAFDTYSMNMYNEKVTKEGFLDASFVKRTVPMMEAECENENGTKEYPVTVYADLDNLCFTAVAETDNGRVSEVVGQCQSVFELAQKTSEMHCLDFLHLGKDALNKALKKETGTLDQKVAQAAERAALNENRNRNLAEESREER